MNPVRPNNIKKYDAVKTIRSNRVRRYGVTLVEVMIAVAIVGILALIAMPNFMSAVERVRGDTCITNLRAINLAKEQWALENNIEVGDTGSTPLATDLDGYIKDGTSSLWCPLDTTETFANSYTINTLGTDPICKKSTDHRL